MCVEVIVCYIIVVFLRHGVNNYILLVVCWGVFLVRGDWGFYVCLVVWVYVCMWLCVLSCFYTSFVGLFVFSARCNIYISLLCYDASVRLSVRLSVTFVHCGHRVQWILDIFACLDRYFCDVFATYWQRLTRIVGWDDARISGGRGGGVEKLVIVAISL